MAKCDLYWQPIRCSSPCDTSKGCSYFVGLSLPPPAAPTPRPPPPRWLLNQKTVRSLLVNQCMGVGITTGKWCGSRGCETLWPPPHLPLLKNSCCEPTSAVCSVNKNPLQRVKKNTPLIRSTIRISWEINTPSVTYGHRKSVSVNLFVCLIAYIPTFRKFWGLGNKLMVKKQNKTKAQTSIILWCDFVLPVFSLWMLC